jgi:hypothetical protein
MTREADATDIGTGIASIALEIVSRGPGHAWVVGATLQTIGVALMIVGAAGLAVSLFLWSSWGVRWRRRRTPAAQTDPVVRGRRFGPRRDEHDDVDKAA